MKLRSALPLLALIAFCPSFTSAEDKPLDEGFKPIFDGQSLKGWHVSAKSGHSRKSGNQSGGKWEVKDGVIHGSQDQPGNGGLLLSDELYGEVEVVVEMKNDFGPDSGLFLRSTPDGKCYQALVDYHEGGSLMGIYGEGLGGKPHLRFFSFGATPGRSRCIRIERPVRCRSPMPRRGRSSGKPVSGMSCARA